MNVEDALTEAGAAWRSGQPAPPEPNPSRFTQDHPRPRLRWTLAVRDRGARKLAPRAHRWAPIAALAGVTVVIAAIAVPLLAVRPDGPSLPVGGATPPLSVPADWALPADPGTGVRVVGHGMFLREGPGKPIRLCADVRATLDLPSSHAGCGPVSVATTGAAPALLIRTTTNGQAYSDPVRVEGIYHDGTLAVTAQVMADAVLAPGYTEPPVPCPAPSNGWALGQGTDDWEALNRLTEFVRSQGERFTDIWQGHPDGPPKPDNSYQPLHSVYVIGTTGDVRQAETDLRKIYPGNLCVHAVTHTANELNEIVERLRSISSMPVDARADPIRGAVRVKVVALDPSTLDRLRSAAGNALIVEQPMLIRSV